MKQRPLAEWPLAWLKGEFSKRPIAVIREILARIKDGDLFDNF